MSFAIVLAAALLGAGSADEKPMTLEWKDDAEPREIVVAFEADVLPMTWIKVDGFEITVTDRGGDSRSEPPATAKPVGAPTGPEGGVKRVKKALLRLARPGAEGSKYSVRLVGTLGDQVAANGGALESAQPLEVAAKPEQPDAGFRLGRGMPRLEVTPRTGDSESDFALDFKAAWVDLDVTDLDSSGARKISAHLTTQGTVKSDLFESSSSTDTQVNSIEAKLDFAADVFHQKVGSDTQMTYFGVDVHGRTESTQDFEATTYDGGAGMALQPGFLLPQDPGRWNVLDASGKRRPFSAPRLYAGVARLLNADSTNRAVRTGDTSDSFTRVEAAAAWRLPVFSEGVEASALWRGFWDLDADGNGFEPYLEATLEVDAALLGASFAGKPAAPDGDPKDDTDSRWRFVLKYVGGGLPPNFGTDHAVTFGVVVGF